MHTFFKSNLTRESVSCPLFRTNKSANQTSFSLYSMNICPLQSMLNVLYKTRLNRQINKTTHKIACKNLKLLFSKPIYEISVIVVSFFYFIFARLFKYPYNMCVVSVYFPLNTLSLFIHRPSFDKISIFHVVNRLCIKYCQKPNNEQKNENIDGHHSKKKTDSVTNQKEKKEIHTGISLPKLETHSKHR